MHSDLNHFNNLFWKGKRYLVTRKSMGGSFREAFLCATKQFNFGRLEKLLNFGTGCVNANKISSYLRKMGYHLDVGKETFFTGDLKLSVLGFVPRH